MFDLDFACLQLLVITCRGKIRVIDALQDYTVRTTPQNAISNFSYISSYSVSDQSG